MTVKEFLSKITIALNQPLPGIKAHQLLTPGKRPLTREEVEDIENYRKSAVSIICYPENDVVNAILIQRPQYNGTHGGQISFPGGKVEEEDFSVEKAARREANEEIGWELNDEDFLGELTELFIPVSKFSVQPFLYFCKQPQQFIPDEREVAEIIHFPIKVLLDDATIKKTSLKMQSGINLKDVPYFDIDNRVVWGATAIILSELRAMFK